MKTLNELLDPLHKEDLANKDHPSIYIEHENYKLLILRLPFVNKNGDILMFSKGFVFYGEDIFVYDQQLESLEKLDNGWFAFHALLDLDIDKTLILANSINEEVIDMEESLYGKHIPQDLLSNWFMKRRDLIRLNRVMVRTIEMFERFYSDKREEIGEYINSFHDLLEHLTRSQRYIEHDIEKLNSIYSFYSAINNDKMNRSIYLLTIISAIFLPLNLVVGFFGMNTGTLPFTNDGGTLNVVMILSAISIALVLYLVLVKQK